MKRIEFICSRKAIPFGAEEFRLEMPIILPGKATTRLGAPGVMDFEKASAIIHELFARDGNYDRHRVDLMCDHNRTRASQSMAGLIGACKGAHICFALINEFCETCCGYTQLDEIVPDSLEHPDFLWISWADIEHCVDCLNAIHSGIREALLVPKVGYPWIVRPSHSRHPWRNP